ncbi:MAG TPA: hypothetical protein PK020_00460 [Ilumatobacteraceae bacterium]|mgnify:CR=1 FL=1|nr:hypothetical protein [Ilumatobacteraceae bacterium]HRB03379.1 hypothetical protein [Ilumatobacteraceae bacterium]
MSNLQVKNVEPEVHDQLRRRAAAAGSTISDYVLELIRKDLRRPAHSEWLAAAAQLPRHGFSRDDITAAIDAERARR